MGAQHLHYNKKELEAAKKFNSKSNSFVMSKFLLRCTGFHRLKRRQVIAASLRALSFQSRHQRDEQGVHKKEKKEKRKKNHLWKIINNRASAPKLLAILNNHKFENRKKES